MHPEASNKTRGSILQQILKTPVCKDILRVNLNEMRPESGRSLVQTLVQEDPEVFLSLVSALPGFVNFLISASGELATQLKNMYPPEILKSYLITLVEDIDRESLVKSSAAFSELVSSLLEASSGMKLQAKNTFLSSGPAAIAGTLNIAARSLNTLIRHDPGILSRFASDIFREADRQEIREAALSLAEALLDQKWHLIGWALQLTRRRIRKRFGI